MGGLFLFANRQNWSVSEITFGSANRSNFEHAKEWQEGRAMLEGLLRL